MLYRESMYIGRIVLVQLSDSSCISNWKLDSPNGKHRGGRRRGARPRVRPSSRHRKVPEDTVRCKKKRRKKEKKVKRWYKSLRY